MLLGLFCAGLGVTWMHAQASEPLVIGLSIEAPGEGMSANEKVSVEDIRKYLEWRIKQSLESPLVRVTVRDAGPAQQAQGLDGWLREVRARYYLKGDVSHALGLDRSFTWRLDRVGPQSYTMLVDGRSYPVHTGDATRTKPDLNKAVDGVRDDIRRVLGIGGARKILVSCFRISKLPRNETDRGTLTFLSSTLPTQLAASIGTKLADQGFKTKGLDTQQAESLCTPGGFQPLEALKRGHDCIIGGAMHMPTPQRMELHITVEWRERDPMTLPAYEGDIEGRLKDDVVKHVLDHLKMITSQP